jgi:hypothetical protein
MHRRELAFNAGNKIQGIVDFKMAAALGDQFAREKVG